MTAGIVSGDFNPWAPGSARDRLSSTLFLAALFHGVLIMGISFQGEEEPVADSAATNLEVVLVKSLSSSEVEPEDAQLLSQQNLIGSGNAPEDAAVQVAREQQQTPSTDGLDQPVPKQSETAAREGTAVAAALTSEREQQIKMSRYADNGERQPQSFKRKSLPGTDNPVEIVSKPDLATVLPSAKPRELVISANTKESRISSYLESWKREIEKIGTLHYPHLLGPAETSKNPTLQVAIAADGSLQQVIVMRSSGNREVDQAAREILQIASPFDAFPEFLQHDYDVLRFAYEWHFSGEVLKTQVTMVKNQR